MLFPWAGSGPPSPLQMRRANKTGASGGEVPLDRGRRPRRLATTVKELSMKTGWHPASAPEFCVRDFDRR